MKYYKCINGTGWSAFEANKIYDENTKTEGGTTIRRIKERGLFGKDFEEVSYADYLKQEYDAGRISIDYIGHKLLNGDIYLSAYFLIFSNKTNNMEELKLEKNKVIETYNNGCSEVKKTLEGLFGKEIFENKYLDLSTINTHKLNNTCLCDNEGNYILTNASSGPYPKKSLWLNDDYKWELLFTNNNYYLLPTKKLK